MVLGGKNEIWKYFLDSHRMWWIGISCLIFAFFISVIGLLWVLLHVCLDYKLFNEQIFYILVIPPFFVSMMILMINGCMKKKWF